MKPLREIFKKPEPSLVDLRAAMNELHQRELEVRARRNELAEGRRDLAKLGTAQELIAADKEVADLETELNQIEGQVPYLIQQIDRAEGREAVEHAAKLLREIPALAKEAEQTQQAWTVARDRLTAAVAELERQREAAKREGFSPQRVPPKLFDRLAAVLNWLRAPDDHIAGLHVDNKPARLWRHKAQLLDEHQPG